jgi:hypothetical protein
VRQADVAELQAEALRINAFEQPGTEAAVHLDAEANDPLGQTRAVPGLVSVTSVLSAISVLNLCVLHIAPEGDWPDRRLVRPRLKSYKPPAPNTMDFYPELTSAGWRVAARSAHARFG